MYKTPLILKSLYHLSFETASKLSIKNQKNNYGIFSFSFISDHHPDVGHTVYPTAIER